jgi:hypothetical protein
MKGIYNTLGVDDAVVHPRGVFINIIHEVGYYLDAFRFDCGYGF